MALFGLQVVQADGSPITARQAVFRTLVLPLQLRLAGLGLSASWSSGSGGPCTTCSAGTAVVYAWDARAARFGGWRTERSPSLGARR